MTENGPVPNKAEFLLRQSRELVPVCRKPTWFASDREVILQARPGRDPDHALGRLALHGADNRALVRALLEDCSASNAFGIASAGLPTQHAMLDSLIECRASALSCTPGECATAVHDA